MRMHSPSARRPSRHLAGLLAATLLATASPLTWDVTAGGGIRLATATLQAKQNLTIDRIEIPGSILNVTLSGIVITGSSLSRTEVEGLLKATALAGLADRVAKFDAERITIAALTMASAIKDANSSTTYEKLDLRNIKAGVVGRAEIAGGFQESTAIPRKSATSGQGGSGSNDAQPVAIKTKIGTTTIEAVDFVTTLRWLSESDPSGKAPLKPIHGMYRIASMELSGPGFSGTFGPASASTTLVRLPVKPFTDTMKAFEALAAQAASADSSKGTIPAGVLVTILQMYDSFAFGRMDFAGATFTGKDDKTGKDIAIRLGPGRFDGGASAKGAFDGLEIALPDGSMRIKTAGWEGDFYKTLFVGLAKAALSGKDAAKITPEDRAQLTSAISGAALTDLGLNIDGIDADLPQKEGSRANGERIRFSLARYAMRLGSFFGAVPTAIATRLEHFRMPIPTESRDKGFAQLRAFGLKDLDLSFNIDGKWDQPTSRLSLRDLSGSIENLAGVAMAAELGNIPQALFEDPMRNWTQALMSGTVREARISISNRGGLDKVIAKAAADQGKSAEQFRLEVSTMGPAIIAAFMSDHPDAGQLTDALGGFLRGLGELSLVARASQPDGISVLDLGAAASNPPALLKKLRFEARGK